MSRSNCLDAIKGEIRIQRNRSGARQYPCHFPGCTKFCPVWCAGQIKQRQFFYRYCSEAHYKGHLESIRAGAEERVKAFLAKKNE